MSTAPSGAPAPSRRLTRFTPFQHLSSDKAHLFAVNEGLSASAALEEAACFLSTATECVRTLAMELAEEGAEDYRAWSALYLSEISYAVVVAAASAIRREERGHE